jgi:hypothetical protein
VLCFYASFFVKVQTIYLTSFYALFALFLGTDYTHGTLENLTKHASCFILSFVNAFKAPWAFIRQFTRLP